MLPAREGEPEVVEHMPERLAGKGHREAVGMGEVGQRLAAGRMLLAEDQLALRALGRPPMGDVPLQGAQHPIRIAAGMQPLQFLKQRRGANAGRAGRGSAQSRRAKHPGRDRHGCGTAEEAAGSPTHGPCQSAAPCSR